MLNVVYDTGSQIMALLPLMVLDSPVVVLGEISEMYIKEFEIELN